MQEISLTSEQTHWCRNFFDPATSSHGADAETWQYAPLKVEASHRHFYRVTEGKDNGADADALSYILMVSPPELERNDQFVALQKVFAAHSVPVPDLIEYDLPLGLFILSDLGRQDFEAAYGTSDRDSAIRSAIDMLHIIQSIQDEAIEPYTRERLVMELEIFQQWFADELLHTDASTFLDACTPLLHPIEAQPTGCVHRDYHCRNLLFGHGSLGVVDFQDALHGPCLYDLASLLRDCYYTFTESEVDTWLKYFLQGTDLFADADVLEVRRMLDYTAIQRQLKAIGIFARLHLRDQKSSHLPYILPLLDRLRALTASYPELTSLNKQLIGCTEPAKHFMDPSAS